jgi:DNA-binding PadR family transcriptional regulator
VLGLLRDGERSGYDIQKGIERSVGYFWASAKTQIYAVLPRLVDAGLATRRDVVQQQRPDKQLYRITRLGERALRSWLEQPLEPVRNRNELLLKLFFGERTSPEVLLGHVRARREEADALRERLLAIDEADAGGANDRYRAMTRRWGLEYARATIRWAADVERELEGLVGR